MSSDQEIELFCSDCGDPCEAAEETFDYTGTHCTNGLPGTHYTGVYVSDCCGAELKHSEDLPEAE